MKKVFLAITLVLVFAFSAIAVFLLTFDINKYNDAVAGQMQNAVGNPVEIGKLSLKWKGPIVLGIEGLSILKEEGGASKSVLSLEKAEMALNVFPLLKKQISVSSIMLQKPDITVLRGKDGVIKVLGYDPPSSGGDSDPGKAQAGAGAVIPVFNIDSITLRDGRIRFWDLYGELPVDVLVEKLEADVKDVSMIGPVKFKVKAAVFTKDQNAEVSGTAGGFVKGPMFVKDLVVKTDLGTIDFPVLVKSVPMVKKAGLLKGPEGVLDLKVPVLKMEADKISELTADLSFTGGKLSVKQLKAPVEAIDLSARVRNDLVTVRSFSAKLSNASLKGSGDIADIFTAPKTSFKTAVEIPGVRSFAEEVLGGKQHIDGKMGLSIDGKMSGTEWETISRTLSASGIFTLENGILVDTNIVKGALGPLNMFPGLIEQITAMLPLPLQEAMGKEYTLLKPINQDFTIENGAVSLNDLKINTDFADVDGSASLALTGDLSGRGMMIFNDELSAAMTKAASVMGSLADNNGKIMFPIEFNVAGGRFSVLPDIKYITQKTVLQQGQQLISGLLQKGPQPEQLPGGQQPAELAAGSAEPKGVEDIMGMIRQMAKEAEVAAKKTVSDSTQNQ